MNQHRAVTIWFQNRRQTEKKRLDSLAEGESASPSPPQEPRGRPSNSSQKPKGPKPPKQPKLNLRRAARPPLNEDTTFMGGYVPPWDAPHHRTVVFDPRYLPPEVAQASGYAKFVPDDDDDGELELEEPPPPPPAPAPGTLGLAPGNNGGSGGPSTTSRTGFGPLYPPSTSYPHPSMLVPPVQVDHQPKELNRTMSVDSAPLKRSASARFAAGLVPEPDDGQGNKRRRISTGSAVPPTSSGTSRGTEGDDNKHASSNAEMNAVESLLWIARSQAQSQSQGQAPVAPAPAQNQSGSA